MTRRTKQLVAGTLALGFVLALTGCKSSQSLQLENELTATKAQLAQAQQQASDLQKQVELLQQAASSTVPPSGPATVTVKAKPKPAATSTEQFAYIKKMSNATGTTVITADYASFLTGKAAAVAAKAHGDESPPPNDYYIVNDNKLLRKLPVKKGITVLVAAKPSGEPDVAGYPMTLSQWLAVWNGTLNPAQQVTVKSDGYKLTLKNGTVIAIKQQYVP